MSCILRHRGIQLILAYSWAKPAIFVVGKDRGGRFLFHSDEYLRAYENNEDPHPHEKLHHETMANSCVVVQAN